MKNEKNYVGFLITKIWQILKRFAGTFHWVQTSYFWRVINGMVINFGAIKYFLEFKLFSVFKIPRWNSPKNVAELSEIFFCANHFPPLSHAFCIQASWSWGTSRCDTSVNSKIKFSRAMCPKLRERESDDTKWMLSAKKDYKLLGCGW